MRTTPEDLNDILQNEDWCALGQLLDERFFGVLLTHPLELCSALERVPAEWFADHPRHRFAKVLASTLGQPIMCNGDAYAALSQANELATVPAVRDVLGVLYSRLNHRLVIGQFDDAGRIADEVCSVIETGDDTRGFEDVMPVLLFRVGTTRLLQGDVPAAIAALWDARRWATFTERHPVDVHLRNALALCFALQGDVARAKENLAPRADGQQPPAGTWAARLERTGRLANAVIALAVLDEPAVTSALNRLGRDADADEFWWVVEHIRARYALYWGDRAEAIEQLGQELSRRRSLAPAASYAGTVLRADLSDLCQAEGELVSAAIPLLAGGLNPHDPRVVASRARLELLRGDPTAALSILEDFVGLVASPPGVPATISALRAIAAFGLDDQSACATALLRCHETRLLRSSTEVLTEIPSDLCMLAEEHGIPLPRESVCVYRYAAPVRLSARELDVLSVMAVHRSTQAVADALFISVNTAKSHLRSLYKKLDVCSRDQAIRRSVELGLSHTPRSDRHLADDRLADDHRPD